MAKKQQITDVSAPDEDRVSLQLRIETELHEKLRATADEAGISVNQLIQGICWGAIENVVQGEVRRNNEFVHVQPRKKCLFFGRLGHFKESQHEIEEMYRDGIDPTPVDNGEYWFGLDFTNRGVVR